MVKTLSTNGLIEVIDFATVVVADSYKLSITANAGESWTDHQILRPLRAMSWVDAKHGWAITDQSALWRLTIVDGRLDVEVLDKVPGGSPSQVYFADTQRGYATSGGSIGMILATNDAGRTWGDGLSIGEVNSAAQFHGRGNRFCYVNGWGHLYMRQSGGFARVQIPSFSDFGHVTFADGITAVGNRNANTIAVSHDDITYSAVNRDLRTSTQVLSGWLSQVFPISKDVWIGHGAYRLTLTRDAGRTWMEPSADRHYFDWIKPFSESRLWAATDDTMNLTLSRAGRL